MKDWLRNFYLPRDLRWKGAAYVCVNVFYVVGLCLLLSMEEESGINIWGILWTFLMPFMAKYIRDISTVIIIDKLQDYFFYIFFTHNICLAVMLVSAYGFLQIYPIWLFIIIAIINICIFSFDIYRLFKDQMIIFKKKLIQHDKHSYYDWSYCCNVGALEYIWLPINNYRFKPHYNIGDMLCLREIKPIYKDGKLDFYYHYYHRSEYIIEDINGKYHLVKIGKQIDIIPDTDTDEGNIKHLYIIEDSMVNMRAYYYHDYYDYEKSHITY